MDKWPLSRIDTVLTAFALALFVEEGYRWYYYAYRCKPSSRFADAYWYSFSSTMFVTGLVALFVLIVQLAVDSLGN